MNRPVRWHDPAAMTNLGASTSSRVFFDANSLSLVTVSVIGRPPKHSLDFSTSLSQYVLMQGNFSPVSVRRHRTALRARCILAVALAAILSPTISPVLLGANPGTRPNFIFILIDDMGYADLSCYGGSGTQTTHLDRLATEGIRFARFYVSAPICSPSRTAFTTGQYPARWHITSYLANRKENQARGMAQWLDPKAPTLPRILKGAGYATGHFGKWHMGGQRDVGEAPLIAEYGFDESLTQFEGLGDRILPLLDAFDGQPARKYALGSDNLGRGEITWMDRSKVTSSFVQRAIQFIDKASAGNRPFYVNLWPDDVHSPFFPPKGLRVDGSKQGLYRSVVKALDSQFAALFDYVRGHPRLGTNTFIIVASDNGPEPGAGSAGSLRGHKGNLYEGGIREPFIVWAPGFQRQQARGTVNETTVVAAVDLLPSVLGLAGVAPPAGIQFDGEDFGRAFLGLAAGLRTKPLFWIRPPDRPGPKGDRWPDLAIREGDWKLLVMEDGSGAQLYDVSRDPGESRNLADQSVIAQTLQRQVLAWRKTLPIALPGSGTNLPGAGR